ncbi:hemerythrin HHE cation-binding protein [Streptomyces sp. NPDC058290]|uniref:hemerythrin HHE cation-binding protein n=1 Tax=Streptomyces sp. NPDC058290 TaxID=3346426 RepID=UPI0036EEEC70
MDGIVLLKEDHKTVEKLFKQFEKAGDDAHAEKRKIADQVIDELTTHTWIEEWFPDVRKAMGRNRLTELGEQMEKAGEPLAVPSAKH